MHVFSAMMYIAMAVTSLFQQPSAFEWNKKSTLNTDRQVEFPGIVLEPGIYTVRLRQSGQTRSTVEILNQGETQLLATLTAVPDHSMRPDDNSDFTFHEVKTRGPVPVHSWYFSGDLVGLEFVYPKERAKEIAKESNDHVMASNGGKDGLIVAVTANGKEFVIDDPATVQTARRKPQL